MKINKPELVAPSGNWSSLITAVENGADSVYFGVKGLNMRNNAENFDILELKKIMNFLHSYEKKGYLALNTIIMNKELTKAEKLLREAKKAKVDAVIVWDMAALSLAKKIGLRVHLSTQASVSNVKALSFFASLGVKRAVLARECTLEDISSIKKSFSKLKARCEIEAFIHGAMCVSISGRCFLSHYSFGKSANRGECLQPCRREYYISDRDKELDYVLGNDYVLSPKDLCAIDFIEDLIKAGINAFKIEGRMRSEEYIKITTSVYRQAIDAFFSAKLNASLRKSLKQQLKTVYNRGFSTGFYFGKPVDSISRNLEHLYEKIFIGEVKKFFNKIKVAEIKLRNESLSSGNQILIIGKNTPANITVVKELQLNHKPVKSVKKGDAVGVKLPFVVKAKDKVFLWRKKK